MKKRTLNSDVKLAVAALLCCASTYTHAEMTCKMIPGPGGIMQEQCTSKQDGGGSGGGGSGGATPVIGVGNGGGSSNTGGGGGGGGGGGSPGTNEPTPEQQKAEEEKKCIQNAVVKLRACEYSALRSANSSIESACGNAPDSTSVDGHGGIGVIGGGGSVSWSNYNRCKAPIEGTLRENNKLCEYSKEVRVLNCMK
ncbi:hypothetical protein J8L98_10195 [Pseudoalteromonas sp. MMG013]|uniref:hypothetical protein n=1 Tax=Pseudoalteromonas sp. MMG013 TaxID=2822687 RepID=UPI001B37C0B2|nr:hypothetical protein [Pseudoalteromonas sp. MMG013]MBQ4862060.1 hypothetical protein [Pseudoalteromonas sp. MMG013]